MVEKEVQDLLFSTRFKKEISISFKKNHLFAKEISNLLPKTFQMGKLKFSNVKFNNV